MKKLLIVLAISATIMACNSGSKTGAENDTTKVGENMSAEAQQSNTDSNVNKIGTDDSPVPSSGANGELLISQSDCLTCHKVNEKLIGPAYVEVANKYDNNDKNLDYLAGKIIAGGSGVWGEIPMTPHPAISQDDAKKMAAYIMTLKTN